jgi:undecaprenyl-diphosphatase
LRRILGRVFARAAQIERTVLLPLALAAGCGWLFVSLADEVLEGETGAWDRAILLALRDASDSSLPWGPRWLQEMARDFTALGGLGVLTLLTLAALGYLVMMRKRHAALLILIAVVGGQLASLALKLGFDRARPDLVPHGAAVYTASFPSGHAMMAAVTYLTLGALLARVHADIAAKVYLLGLAVLLALLVGVTRVYLGVHWPSDVAAGWALGAGWAFACSVVMQWLQRRGEVEAATE